MQQDTIRMQVCNNQAWVLNTSSDQKPRTILLVLDDPGCHLMQFTLRGGEAKRVLTMIKYDPGFKEADVAPMQNNLIVYNELSSLQMLRVRFEDIRHTEFEFQLEPDDNKKLFTLHAS